PTRPSSDLVTSIQIRFHSPAVTVPVLTVPREVPLPEPVVWRYNPSSPLARKSTWYPGELAVEANPYGSSESLPNTMSECNVEVGRTSHLRSTGRRYVPSAFSKGHIDPSMYDCTSEGYEKIISSSVPHSGIQSGALYRPCPPGALTPCARLPL